MRLDEEREAELEQVVARLDRLVPKDGAHLTFAAERGGLCIGNRLGYLRFGVEMLRAALQPLPETDEAPASVRPRLDSLLTPGSRPPFELCEVDESIISRPPVASGLGALGQLGAGVLLVGAMVLLFIGASVLWRWVFG